MGNTDEQGFVNPKRGSSTPPLSGMKVLAMWQDDWLESRIVSVVEEEEGETMYEVAELKGGKGSVWTVERDEIKLMSKGVTVELSAGDVRDATVENVTTNEIVKAAKHVERRSSRRDSMPNASMPYASAGHKRKRESTSKTSNSSSSSSSPGVLKYHEPLTSGMKVVELPPRDKGDYAGIQSDLNCHGFCVVADILKTEERNRFEDLFWSAVQKRKSALSKDMKTWTKENVEWKGTFGVGHFKHYGMGQEEHAWRIRLNGRIKSIFTEVVYEGEKELCVSMDATAGLFRIPDSGNAGAMALHVDLVPGVHGYEFNSVQAAYNRFEVSASGGKGCAGFVCVPGSQLTYKERMDERATGGKKLPSNLHWFVLEKDSPLQKEAALVLSPPNALVVWKSTLEHKVGWSPGFIGPSFHPFPGLSASSIRIGVVLLFGPLLSLIPLHYYRSYPYTTIAHTPTLLSLIPLHVLPSWHHTPLCFYVQCLRAGIRRRLHASRARPHVQANTIRVLDAQE
jgi:hypothetical protein